MKPSLALAAMLAVSGCATNRPPPALEEEQWAQLSEAETAQLQEQQQRQVETPVRCQAQIPPRPAWPLDDPALAGKDLYAKGQAALAEIELRRAYEARLEAALRKCTQPPVR